MPRVPRTSTSGGQALAPIGRHGGFRVTSCHLQAWKLEPGQGRGVGAASQVSGSTRSVTSPSGPRAVLGNAQPGGQSRGHRCRHTGAEGQRGWEERHPLVPGSVVTATSLGAL